MSEDKLIQAEYIQWRKNIPHLYNSMVNSALEWPALSVQWFPSKVRESDQKSQNLLLSIHTSGQDTEYLAILNVLLSDTIIDNLDDIEDVDGIEVESRIKVTHKLNVNEEINRCKWSSNNVNLIATRSDNSDIHIYDYHKYSDNSKNIINPDIVLTGHSKGGYGLDWSSLEEDILVSSGEDCLAIAYDINKRSSIYISKDHTAVVNDVSYSKLGSNLFVSVGDDKKIIIHDIRTKETLITTGHKGDILSCEYNHMNSNVLATGGSDSVIHVWDIRSFDAPISTLSHHASSVTQVRWSPHSDNILASSSIDRRVYIWDLSKIGEKPVDDTPSELLFIHGGHTNSVADFAWNPIVINEIASVAEDNILQIWRRANVD